MKFMIGKSDEFEYLDTSVLNRHGIITGATGTGKTVSLKVIAESLSDLNVPVVLVDIKGDLLNIAKAGEPSEKLNERLRELGVSDFKFRSYPTEVFDLYADEGLPIRVSVSEMGPLLFSKILELSDAQEGILNIVFKIADEKNLLLIDLKDLRAILNYALENSKEFSKYYGNISASSVNAILRKLLVLEEAGGDGFFGAPSIDVRDFLRTDGERAYVNVLMCRKLVNNPLLYCAFLMYLLSEIYESFEEVGDLEKPKLVFFFDEAHLLFMQEKRLVEKFKTIVRLVRSKGVGVFFITQNPKDIPDEITSQLGTKLIHALRAFSQNELKNIKEVSKTFRAKDMDVEAELTNLRTGEALYQSLDEDNAPTFVKKVYMMPPHSSFEPLSRDELLNLIKNSKLLDKYLEPYDPKSAYEILQKSEPGVGGQLVGELFNKSVDSFLGTISRSVGREIARGILGSMKKRR